MSNQHTTQAYGPAINRIADCMAHLEQLSFRSVSRLAKEARVSASSVSRLIHGKLNPSFLLVARLTEALERHVGRRIDPRELVAEDGRFLTHHVCSLMGCKGCLPNNAYDESENVRPIFRSVKMGRWVTSRYPFGYQAKKGVL